MSGLANLSLAIPPHRGFAFIPMLIPAVPYAARRLRLPDCVGYILVGVIVGPHRRGLVPRDNDIADFLADLTRRGRPIVSINATDIANRTTFAILGTDVGLLRSDPHSFPITHAVAASNGFPGLFNSVTLRSDADRCQGRRWWHR